MSDADEEPYVEPTCHDKPGPGSTTERKKCAWCRNRAAVGRSLCVKCNIRRKDNYEKSRTLNRDDTQHTELTVGVIEATRLIDTRRPVHSVPLLIQFNLYNRQITDLSVNLEDVVFSLYYNGVQVGPCSGMGQTIHFDPPVVFTPQSRLSLVLDRPIDADNAHIEYSIATDDATVHRQVFPSLTHYYTMNMIGQVHTLQLPSTTCTGTVFVNGVKSYTSSGGVVVFRPLRDQDRDPCPAHLTPWQYETCADFKPNDEVFIELSEPQPNRVVEFGITYYQSYRILGQRKTPVTWSNSRLAL